MTKLGLRTKILLTLLAVCLLGLVPVYVLFSDVQRSTLRAEALSQAERLAVTMAAGLAGVDVEDSELREEILGGLQQVADAHGVFVVREDGRTYSEEDRALLGTLIEADVLMGLLEGGRARAITGGAGGAETVMASAPVGPSEDSELVDHVVVVMSAVAFERQLALTGQMLLVFGALIFLLVFVAGYLLLTRIVIRPARNLIREMERVQLGESERPLAGDGSAQPEASDELEQLSMAFKRLGKRLRNYQVSMEIAVREQRENNRKLQAAQETLIRSEKLASVGVLTAGIAHEIGNPISVILGYVELLQSGDVSEQDRTDYIAQIHSATQRINTIIRDLLDFSRSSPEGDHTPPLADPVAVIEQSLKLLAPQAQLRNVEVICDLPESCPPTRIHEGRLEQVLVNLLLNAGDAMKGDGKVTIRIVVEPEHVCIAITDEGHGIARKDMNKVFDPFFTTKRPGHGTGLGLSISHQLVQTYGGELKVSSRAGKGATFSVRLLRADVEPGSAKFAS